MLYYIYVYIYIHIHMFFGAKISCPGWLDDGVDGLEHGHSAARAAQMSRCLQWRWPADPDDLQ